MSRKWSLPRKSSLPAILFACFAPLLASAQFVVGGEHEVTAPQTETLARASQVDVASDGNTIVAIWTDTRTDRGSDIIFTRIDQRGRALDPTGISLSSSAASETQPFIAHDGARFVAVWFDGTNTLGASFTDRGVIVTGPVIIAPGQPLALERSDRDLAVAISDGGRITLYDLNASLVPSVIERLGRLGDVRLASFGPGFLAVWVELNSSRRYVVRAMTLDRSGAVAEMTLSQLGSFEHAPTFSAERSGDEAIVAAASLDRYAVARVSPTLTVTVIDAIDSTASFVPQTIEDIVAWPSGFDVVMTRHGRSRVLRYTSAGKTEVEPVAGNAAEGAGTYGAGRVYTLWQVNGTVIGRTAFAEPGDAATITARSVVSQQMPALATSGGSSAIVWVEDFTATQDRVMARVLRTDGPPDAAVDPIILGTRTIHFAGSKPGVAFNGTNYIAVWLDQRNASNQPAFFRMRTFTESGGLFSEFTISTIATASSPPAIAGRPGDALVVWAESGRTKTALASTPFDQHEIGGATSHPAAVYGDGAFLIAAVTPAGSIRGTLVSRTGQLERTVFETVPPFGSLDSKPAVAWNGRTYLVVYRRGTSIQGRLLSRSGETIGSDFPISANVIADNPAVAFDGGAFVVAWTERPSEDALAEGHIFATRVLADQAVQGAQAIAATERNEDFPALAGMGDAHTIIAYQRMSPEAQNVHRVFTRLMIGPRIPIGRRRSVR